MWIAFDLIGVLAGPSWREVVPKPDLSRWRCFRTGGMPEANFWSHDLGERYRQTLAFYPDRLAYLRTLRARGFRICLATNFAMPWLDALRAPLGGDDPFDACVVSSEIGVAKPDPAFFAALRRHVPAGTVFMDDQEPNCRAATAAGLRAVWLQPRMDFAEALEGREPCMIAGSSS